MKSLQPRKDTDCVLLTSRRDRIPRVISAERQRVFWSRVQAEEGAACWRWTGTHDAYGYANFKVQDVDYKVHRVSYELCVGPIPEGLTLDHLCRVRDCVNPLHLEAVTIKENTIRGKQPEFMDKWRANRRRSICINGHEMTPDNIYAQPGLNSHACRACRRISSQRRPKPATYGLPRRPSVLPIFSRTKMRELRESGLSQRAIAANLGCSQMVVCRALRGSQK